MSVELNQAGTKIVIKQTIGIENWDSLRDDFCEQYRYQSTIRAESGEEIPNPQTKEEFIDEKMKSFFRDSVRATRIKHAEEAARDAANTEINIE